MVSHWSQSEQRERSVKIKSIAKRARAVFKAEKAGKREVFRVLVREGLSLHQHVEPTERIDRIGSPRFCIILQGRERVWVGTHRLRLRDGDSMIVSHRLQLASRVTKAKPSVPYLALSLALDLELLRGLYDLVGSATPDSSPAASLAAHATDPKLVDALGRYLDLASDPVEARVLGPLVLKEIHLRLLMAPHGGMLRELLLHDSPASNVARAIEILRTDYRQVVRVPELARGVRMAPSSFHRRFREITGTTPLQYQKSLRLSEAKRMLGAGSPSVAEVAQAVGYESASQFSREYSRRYGVAPRHDIVTGA